MSALRTLQHKISSLEHERSASKGKIRELENELLRMRQLLWMEQTKQSVERKIGTSEQILKDLEDVEINNSETASGGKSSTHLTDRLLNTA